MFHFKRISRTARWAGILALCVAAVPADADYFLVRKLNIDSYFGPLGSNPFTMTFDGTYAYVGGYSGTADPRDVGILKININDPTDVMALPAGNQTINQFRYYGGFVVRDEVLYALLDRPDGSTASTNVRAIDVNTGGLVPTFDGDFGDGDGIVAEPAALVAPALGGLAYDPGFGGLDSGLSLLAFGSGRRSLIDISDGITLYDSGDGMIVTDITGTCTVSDASAWRDHVYDDAGNVYMRRSNQVQTALRTGPNAIGSYGHLTDELNGDGTPKAGCGDGRPVATRIAPFVVGQHIDLIKASSAGANEDLIIFNDRFNNSEKAFTDVVKLIDTNGNLPDPPVEFLMGDGTPLNSNGARDGIGLYDFHYDADQDLLLILDFSDRNLLVFSGTQPCNDPPQDFDDDGDVDLTDYAAFEECLNGPGVPWPGPPVDQAYCGCVDRGGDGDVDLVDFFFFQLAYTGSSR
jgi:hypothetical protein